VKPRTITAIAAAVSLVSLQAALAAPLKTRTLGTKSQQVVMCPDCSEKIACAKAGDYTIGFDADLDSPKTGAAKVAVHVKDAAGNPVENAVVTVNLAMPDHQHGKAPLKLKSVGHGRYQAATQLVMPGGWKATVEVKPATGDTVKQTFSFIR
jgi:hypothetical protein